MTDGLNGHRLADLHGMESTLLHCGCDASIMQQGQSFCNLHEVLGQPVHYESQARTWIMSASQLDGGWPALALHVNHYLLSKHSIDKL